MGMSDESTPFVQEAQKFIRLTSEATAIQDSAASWGSKFEMIFSPLISGAIRELAFRG